MYEKVVMTGSATEGERIASHARTKARREALARRFKDPEDNLRLVIVCDMWLTGFDCPPMHTMYLDKPLAGHNLMQAIARVNRVFGEKPGGVVVDFLGIADQLRDAVQTYTQAGGEGSPVEDIQKEAVPLMERQFEALRDFFNGFDYSDFIIVESRSFRESLETILTRYTNRAITTAQVIEELIGLACEIRDAANRGEEFGLTDEELTFYDALADNESAREVIQDETLRLIARELSERIKAKTSLDWTHGKDINRLITCLDPIFRSKPCWN